MKPLRKRRDKAQQNMDNAMEVLLPILRRDFPALQEMSDTDLTVMCQTIHRTLPMKGAGMKGKNALGEDDDLCHDSALEV